MATTLIYTSERFVRGSRNSILRSIDGPRLVVTAGSGNDQVLVLDLCEVVNHEVLDGGADTDTLWLPAGVTVTTLQTIGVTVIGFEVVDEIEGGTWGTAECALDP